MKTFRALTLACALFLASATAFAGDGVTSPGADIIAPPPPSAGQTSQFPLYAVAVWLQLRGITIRL